jgi:SAM-dependent methyltransferase
MSVFAYYAQYYDLLYHDKDYAAEARFVADLLRRHSPAATALVELGCGTGAHAALLAEAGFAVFGIDASADMIARAKARRAQAAPEVAQRLAFTLGDVREHVGTETYDAAISLFHVMSYQTTNRDLAQAFATARRALRTGGIFLFDSWYGPAVLQQRPERRIKRWQDETLRIVRFAEPVWHANDNCVDVNYEIVVTDTARKVLAEVRETHAMRYLFLPEVELLLDNAGFALEWHGEWLTGGELGSATWNACFVARAR